MCQTHMRLAVLAFTVAEISLPGHCHSECTLLQTTSRTRSQFAQLSQLPEEIHAEHGHVGPPQIPCVIHQTWKTHELSSHQAAVAKTWKLKNPKCEYRLWNDTEIAELCRQKSPNLIWPIWETLSPVQRADIFRYLVLWDQGGYYADIDVRCEKPIAEFPVPKDVSMIVGYETGHRLGEHERSFVKFARVEQFEQWFLASAPGNPILLRCLEIVQEKSLWKVQDTVDLTGPGSFSDAVHEFLADAEGQDMTTGAKNQADKTANSTDHDHRGNLTFPSESEYRAGTWNLWLLASGRTAKGGYTANDPLQAAEAIVHHEFAGSWKPPSPRKVHQLTHATANSSHPKS